MSTWSDKDEYEYDPAERQREREEERAERLYKTTWIIKPVANDRICFSLGDVLLPMREFPENNRLVRVRREGEYEHCGMIEGDGATAFQRRFVDPLPKLVVKYVSELSGHAKARLQEYEVGGDHA